MGLFAGAGINVKIGNKSSRTLCRILVQVLHEEKKSSSTLSYELLIIY